MLSSLPQISNTPKQNPTIVRFFLKEEGLGSYRGSIRLAIFVHPKTPEVNIFENTSYSWRTLSTRFWKRVNYKVVKCWLFLSYNLEYLVGIHVFEAWAFFWTIYLPYCLESLHKLEVSSHIQFVGTISKMLVESLLNVLFLKPKHVIFEPRCLFMLRNLQTMFWNPKTPWKPKKHQKLVKPDKLPFWHGHALRVEVEPTSGRSGPPWTFKMLSFSVPCVISSSIRPEPLLIRPEFRFYPKTNLKLEPNWIGTKMDHSTNPIKVPVKPWSILTLEPISFVSIYFNRIPEPSYWINSFETQLKWFTYTSI